MIIHGREVKEKLLQGIDLVANTVKPTLGPQAKTVILQGNPPIVINDGVTITKYITHEDPYVQMGIEMVQNLASQAQDKSGDGTTTACILAQAFCHALFDLEDKYSTHEMNTMISDAKEKMLSFLEKWAIEIEDEDILDVATIAANNDAKLGQLIQDGLNLVGRDGIVTVEESKNYATELVHRDGMEIPEGYISHLMCNTAGGKVEFENPIIFMSNLSFRQFKDILPMLEYSSTQGRPLLILCKGMEGACLNNLVMNLINKTVECAVILAPNFGDAQIDELTDIQSLIGGKPFISESKDDPTIFVADDFGSCSSVIVTKETTTFVGGEGDTKARIETLKETSKDMKGHELGRIKSRIARLNGGVATIRIGASSSIEMRETKERLDDALNATKAALESGIVLGGGMTLFEASNSLDLPEWFRLSLREPLNTLKRNGGFTRDPTNSKLIDLRKNDKTFGYDALKNEFADLDKAGVYDPVKVTANSFLASLSIAQLFYSTEVAVLVEE